MNNKERETRLSLKHNDSLADLQRLHSISISSENGDTDFQEYEKTFNNIYCPCFYLCSCYAAISNCCRKKDDSNYRLHQEK